MKTNRIARVNSLLKEVLFEVIQKEVRNPHVNAFISISEVDTSKDLHYATVFVSLIGTPAEKRAVLDALQSAAGFIAVQASRKVTLHYFPELVFKLDTSLDEQMKIQDILQKIEAERLSRPVQDTE